MSNQTDMFVAKITEQLNKTLEYLASETPENSKRMFIIDNKSKLDNIGTLINNLLKEDIDAEDKEKVMELKVMYETTKKEIYDSLLSINKEDFEEEKQTTSSTPSGDSEKKTYVIIADGKPNIFFDHTKAMLSECINKSLKHINFDDNDTYVFECTPVQLKTKVVVL